MMAIAQPGPLHDGRRIQVLPPEVAARIAAGEVIERPVSVVRELLDNAIDAGAGRISIEIEDGGLSLIRIIDDGRGIPPEDLELAFERHATSKIGALLDLTKVRTLGFRGEALPSIAAAGDVEVTSRVASEPVGVQVVLLDGRVVRRAARPVPTGTSFAVRNLFRNLPARRKFLNSPVAETRRVTVLVSHYALAYPGIAFTLSSGGRRMLSTTGDGALRHAFSAIHGATAAAQMLEVNLDHDGLGVAGLAGPPSLNRGNRAAISVFVNGRWVQSRPLTFSVVDAYQSQLPIGRHPLAALRIAVPEGDVDVNVHPAKAEVRFRDERLVARTVRQAVGAALDGARPVEWATASIAAAEPTWLSPATPLRDGLGATSVPTAIALRPPEPVQASLQLSSPASNPVAPTATTYREVLPLLRVVGQMGGTYIIAEGPDGMYLLDQHAAHERVVYDRLLARTSAFAPEASQPLLEPVLVELDPVSASVLEEHRAHLESLGLVIEPFGECAYLVREVPPGLGGTNIPAAITLLLDKLASERRVADPLAKAAATVACHSSVRAGMALAMDEMRALVTDLERTAQPRTCPHGRPTLIHVSTELLERQFGRR
jgi:DNA mismatch repair protein MutL